MPKCSVIIPCYNYAQYVGEAIESAINQTWKDKEVIVVDDGSTDSSAEVIRKYNVEYIYQRNAGLSAARNTGIKAATGEKILCLDADDTVDLSYLEHGQKYKGIFLGGTKTYEDGGKTSYVLPNPKYMRLSDFLLNNRLCCASLFDKKDWEEVGGFDENMKDGYEDWEFWIRLVAKGCRITCFNEFMFFYRRHGRSMAHDAMDKDREIRNYIYEKHILLYNPNARPDGKPKRPGGICEFCGTNPCMHYPKEL